MALEMDDLEFLLPSELLTDDDVLTDFGCCLGKSDLSSPVESVNGSDEDDFVSELTRTLTHSTLRDPRDHPEKGLKLSGSPQSTLSGFNTGSVLTPNADSRVFSPPDAKDALSWDMLYAAAEKVARIRMAEEAAAFYASNNFGPARNPNSGSGFLSNPSQNHPNLSYQQFQAAKLEQMKHQQLVLENRVMGQGDMEYFLQNRMIDVGGGRAYRSSIPAWPTVQQSQQQLNRSGLNPAYFGETGQVKERVGTGVFMPRRFGSNQPETRKKPDAVLKPKNDVSGASIQGRNRTAHSMMKKQECRLPQEWTY